LAISIEKLQAYLILYESIKTGADNHEAEPIKSGVARVRGSLKAYLANLNTLNNHLASREAKSADVEDLARIANSLKALIDDAWVREDLVGVRFALPTPEQIVPLTLPSASSETEFVEAISALVSNLKDVMI
jgi:hypothetical protein